MTIGFGCTQRFASVLLLPGLFLFFAVIFLPVSAAVGSSAENVGTTNAATIPLSKQERQWLTDHSVITAGIDPDFAPFEFIDDTGQYHGMSHDYLKEIGTMLGIRFEAVHGLSWSEVVDRSKKLQIDVLPCVGKTGERKEFLEFTEPYLSFPRIIIYRQGRERPENIGDLEGTLIGVQADASHHGWIKENTAFKPILYPTSRSALFALSRGDIDAFIGDLATDSYQIEKLQIDNLEVGFQLPGGAQELSIGVRKDWPEFTAVLNKALKAIPHERELAIQHKWIAKRLKDADTIVKSLSRYTDEERAWLATHPKVTVRTMSSWPPMNFLSRSGEPAGIGNGILQRLGKITGLNIQVVPGLFKENLEAVQTHQADALMDVTPKHDRAEYLNFTAPYLSVAHVIIGTRNGPYYKSAAELKGKTVAVEEEFGNIKNLRTHFPEVHLRIYPDTASCLKAVSDGSVDAFAGNRAVASYIITQQLFTNLQIQGDLHEPELTIGVRKDMPLLVSILDKALQGISTTDKQQIMKKWVGLHFPEPSKEVALKLTPEEKLFISRNEPLSFSEIPWKPMSIVENPEQYEGLIDDLLSIIDKRSGLKFRYEQSESWDEVLEKYRRGQIALIPAISRDDPIDAEIVYSNPFITFPMVVVTGEKADHIDDTAELNGLEVAVGKDNTAYRFLHDNYPEIQLRVVDDIQEGLILLANAKVDAYVGHLAAAIDTIQRLGFKNLKVAGETEYLFEHRIGVSPNYPEVLSIINKTLSSMTTADRQAVINKWLTVTYEKGRDYGLLIKIVIGAVLFLGVVLFWNRKLASEVAERKKAQELLEASQNHIRAMSLAVHDALIMIDSSGHIHYWNRSAEELFGLSEEEAMGGDVLAFIADEYKTLALKGLKDLVEAGTGNAVSQIREMTAQRVDKTEFPVEIAISAFLEKGEWYAVGTVRDITERQNAEAELKKLSKAVEQSPASVLITDKDGVIEYINPAFTGVSGYTFDEAVGKRPSILNSGKHPQQFYIDMWDTITNGNTWYGEIINKKKNGELYWENASISPLYNHNGEIDHYLAVKQDITERKKR